MTEYGVFPGHYFTVFGLETETYLINVRIQSEYGKIQTRKLSHSDIFHKMIDYSVQIKTCIFMYFVLCLF